MHFDAVDDNLDVMSLVAVHHHAEFELSNHTIDANTGEASLAYVFKQFAVMTLAAADCGCQDVDALAVKFFKYQVGDLLFCVSHHFLARIVGIGFADAGIEQAQEIVNLGDGAHGGTRVLVHTLLLDANDWT